VVGKRDSFYDNRSDYSNHAFADDLEAEDETHEEDTGHGGFRVWIFVRNTFSGP